MNFQLPPIKNEITKLAPNEVFVFGSNEGGLHLGGAARAAYDKFGAKWFQHEGLAGQSYAIPTLNVALGKLHLHKIRKYVKNFLAFAEAHPELTFLVTPIGCGIAGRKVKEIAPLFEGHPSNVKLPEEFTEAWEYAK